jgi:choline dehydrogenase
MPRDRPRSTGSRSARRGAQSQLWRTSLDWAFVTTPQCHADDREVYWPRAKLLGGTSCLDTMILGRDCAAPA